jgi:hypothetical protein
LSAADQLAESTPFVEFMLQALSLALKEATQSEPVTDQVTDQVARLLLPLRGMGAMKVSELMEEVGLAHKATFRANYLKPALAAGLIEMTDPDSPKSPAQRYRLTELANKPRHDPDLCRSELAPGGVPTMVVNDNARNLTPRGALRFFASKLAPTGDLRP